MDFQGITISYALSNSASEFVPFFGLVSSRDPKSKGYIRDLQAGDKKVTAAGPSPGIWAHLLQNLNLIFQVILRGFPYNHHHFGVTTRRERSL